MRLSNTGYLKRYMKAHPELDFSESFYTGSHDPITFECKIHGHVTLLQAYKLNTAGCPECGKLKRQLNLK